MSFSILSIHLSLSFYINFHSYSHCLRITCLHKNKTETSQPILSHFINNRCHSYIIPNELISYSILPRYSIHPSYILTILISDTITHCTYFFYCPLPQHSDPCNIMWLTSKLLYRIYILISTAST